jgi:hypothetical protein
MHYSGYAEPSIMRRASRILSNLPILAKSDKEVRNLAKQRLATHAVSLRRIEVCRHPHLSKISDRPPRPNILNAHSGMIFISTAEVTQF